MELILQPTSETCGQACISMITGKTIEEVIKDMKTSGPTSIGQLMEILDFYGVKHAERNTRISKKSEVGTDVYCGRCEKSKPVRNFNRCL